MKNEIVIKEKLKAYVLTLLACLFITVIGIWMHSAEGLIVTLIFFTGILVSLWRIFSHRPSVIFNSEGLIIDSKNHRNLAIPWSEVEKVSYQSSGVLLGRTIVENLYLAIFLKHPEKYSFNWSRTDGNVFTAKLKQPTDSIPLENASFYVCLTTPYMLSDKDRSNLESDFQSKFHITLGKMPPIVSGGKETVVLNEQKSDIILQNKPENKPKFSLKETFKWSLFIFILMTFGTVIISLIGLSVFAKIKPILQIILYAAMFIGPFYFPNKKPTNWLSFILGLFLGIIAGGFALALIAQTGIFY